MTLPYEPVKVIPAHRHKLGRLDALQREQTGLAPVHAVERGHEVPFEKELESAVLPVIPEEQAQAAFTDIV